MPEIVCPHCHTAFQVDESGYAEILRQVRDKEFNKQVAERLALAERDKETALQLARAELEQERQRSVVDKDAEIAKLQAQIASLSELSEAKLLNQLQRVAAEKDAQIQALQAQVQAHDTSKALAIRESLDAVQKERDDLRAALDRAALEKELAEKALAEKYQTQIRDRDEAIERLRDMKARLSTKMLGETLEQHCEVAFNQIRATAFPNAYFEKDTDARSGSKGDYIFRDFDASDPANPIEIVSIMFEMKNEADTTASKKRNEDFFKELDKDRSEKGCEYAVLVSLLESDSELYNTGIVDVSHRYPKMYVIRPQFFLPMITLLRNAALNSLRYRQELALVKAQNIDITNFEAELEGFKGAFAKNYDLAARRFQTAIDEIDKSIDHLQKTKDALLGANRGGSVFSDRAISGRTAVHSPCGRSRSDAKTETKPFPCVQGSASSRGLEGREDRGRDCQAV
jgi:hypothetical protein